MCLSSSVSTILRILLFLILTYVQTSGSQTTVNSDDVPTACLNFPVGYIRNTAPYSFTTKIPVEVDIGIRVWYITEISLEKMAISVDMYLEFNWPDYRIDVNVSCLGFDYKIPEVEADKMWKPFVQYRNCKGCLPIVINPKAYAFYYNETTKKFWTITRDLETFNCDFRLESYPMDHQLCVIQIENYYEDNTMLRLLQKVNSNSTSIASNQTLSEFHVASLSPGDCSIPLYGVVFSCIEMQIRMERYLGFYILTTYIPTTFLVIVSWVSFWLPVDNVPGRVTLGMTSLLTLATRLDLAQKNLPSVSYIKAIDVWICCCLFSVFATLIEFSFASYSYHSTMRTRAVNQFIPPNTVARNPLGMKLMRHASQQPRNTESKYDKAARMVFPLFFVLFVIIYWSVYL